jgi:hypothetical protein
MGLTLRQAEQCGLGHLHPDRAGAPAPEPGRPAPPHARVTGKNALGQNKTEAKFDAILAGMKRQGVVSHYDFEALKVRVAKRRWYTPDFDVWLDDNRFCFIEIKGAFIREDGMLKLQVAAEHSPWPFYLAVYKDHAWSFSELPSRSLRGGCLDAFTPFV